MRLLTILLLALVAFTPPVFAENPLINVQIFRPGPHAGDFVNVQGARVDGHLRWSAQTMISFGKNPLVYVDKTNNTIRRHEVIQDQLTLDIMGSISLFNWVDIGLAVPIFLVNSGEPDGHASPPVPIPGFAMGDIRFSPRVRIWRQHKEARGFALSLDLQLNIPTGDPNGFVSDGIAFQPVLLMDYHKSGFHMAVNLGARIRKPETHKFLQVGNEFVYGGALSYDILHTLKSNHQIHVMAEVHGATSQFDANSTNLEALFGAKYLIPHLGFMMSVGGGSGMMPGYGNTKFRMYASVGYVSPTIIDRDGDGFNDPVDKCPTKPEDVDGFEDKDGCPEPDNDKDGLKDEFDKCPLDAEDRDGYRDEDGCPDLDNDGDGIPDVKDKCPLKAEDKDKFEDTDGCPDTDNDKDGILDRDDRCPNKPENKNFFQDDDGCPDETLARVEKGKIVINDKIYFATSKAKIKPKSFALLRAVAGILQANAKIKRLSIEGHTDDRGGKKFNLRLSQARADSVRQFIINEGVSPDRLVAVGHGKGRPAMQGKTAEAREANRRVEFLILKK